MCPHHHGVAVHTLWRSLRPFSLCPRWEADAQVRAWLPSQPWLNQPRAHWSTTAQFEYMYSQRVLVVGSLPRYSTLCSLTVFSAFNQLRRLFVHCSSVVRYRTVGWYESWYSHYRSTAGYSTSDGTSTGTRARGNGFVVWPRPFVYVRSIQKVLLLRAVDILVGLASTFNAYTFRANLLA